MSGGVGELDSPDAAKVIEVAAYLIVRRISRELSLGNEQVGLGDVGGREVISKEEDRHSGLSVCIFAKYCTA